MDSSNLEDLLEDVEQPEYHQSSYPSPSFADVVHRHASASSLRKYSPVDWRNYFDSEDDVVIPESNDSFHFYLAGNEGPVVLCLQGCGYSGYEVPKLLLLAGTDRMDSPYEQ